VPEAGGGAEGVGEACVWEEAMVQIESCSGEAGDLQGEGARFRAVLGLVEISYLFEALDGSRRKGHQVIGTAGEFSGFRVEVFRVGLPECVALRASSNSQARP
jgi:hypothetical protein